MSLFPAEIALALARRVEGSTTRWNNRRRRVDNKSATVINSDRDPSALLTAAGNWESLASTRPVTVVAVAGPDAHQVSLTTRSAQARSAGSTDTRVLFRPFALRTAHGHSRVELPTDRSWRPQERAVESRHRHTLPMCSAVSSVIPAESPV
jgi:hypothetical protein